MQCPAANVGQGALEDQPALPDHRHPVAGSLDLGEGMARQQQRLAPPHLFLDQLHERRLHQRVEALGGLVEDVQRGIVLEGGH